jgi:hypothetical protein
LDARAKAAAEAGTIPSTLVPWSVHDLRRTVATGLQRLGVRLEVTKAVLNHISGTRAGIAGVYQRHDWASEKRTALVGGSRPGSAQRVHGDSQRGDAGACELRPLHAVKLAETHAGVFTGEWRPAPRSG